ncbi:DUF3500 domain-containing protein [Gaetbulibacter sp. M240]|uniref:DUF3500 domain-containing protein n=1 Tax=Gaetbulibacter sp. M240 TaxID=3126511 RepID=UPI00374FD7EB
MTNIFKLALLIFATVHLSLMNNNEHPAITFLNALSQDQRSMMMLEFNDLSKSNWHYIPATSRPRKGIRLNELNDNQKKLAFNLIQASLSEAGYKKVQKIIDLENVLREISGDTVRRDPDKYALAFYGNPEKDSLWSWSFEGHHISLNFTILNDKTTLAPRFFGANPAIVLSGSRKGERTLHNEEDLGYKLINALSDEQRKLAIFRANTFSDIVTKNSAEVIPLSPAGIPYDALNSSQQEIFQNLIMEYLSTVKENLAVKRMQQLKREELNDIRFGWAGSLNRGEPHYYRIQGKSFLIEFDNTQNNANHIHTVWRDFNGDFGRDLIKEHYETSDHHKN